MIKKILCFITARNHQCHRPITEIADVVLYLQCRHTGTHVADMSYSSLNKSKMLTTDSKP